MKMKKIFHLIIYILLSDFSGKAQNLSFSRQDSISVAIQGKKLENPWAGGLNFPQFSEIDFNGDGIKDLYAFDRSGNQSITYLNKGISDSICYTYSPSYALKFPSDLHDWVLLADYNCDGKEDIFTYSNGGMAVYRNDFTLQTGLHFTRITDLVMSDYGNNNIVNLYLSAPSLPAIADIDGDGDLDVLTFDISGSFVEFHKNMSEEKYGNCDSLEFVSADRCWGKFTGNFSSNSVKFGVSCKGGPPQLPSGTEKHSGSALLAIDLDGDQDKDLLIGDLISKNILMITNGGTSANAVGVAQDSAFPSNTTPIKISLFPATFYLDVDNDGVKDLIAAPNAGNISENDRGIWLYKNIGNTQSPNFIFQKTGFLQDQMIDVGEGANPSMLDYNHDGLMDIVIGNYGYFSPSGTYKSQLMLLKNIGSSQKPAFEVENTDYAGLSAFPLAGMHPIFGDLDADGDPDLICGRADGQIMYFSNQAALGALPNFIMNDASYKQIDIGDFSVPCIYDLNEDGLMDFIVGEKSGNLNYFKNIGSSLIPDFTKSPDNNFLGKVDVMKNCCGGYSSPVFFKENGQTKLLCGSESGYLFYYDQIQNNLNGTFHLIDSSFQHIFEGAISRIAMEDLNGDGKADLVIGNYKGGISIYLQDGGSGIANESIEEKNIRIHPNPANSILNIATEQRGCNTIELYDIAGRCIYTENNSVKNTQIDISGFKNGFYICKISNQERCIVKKIIIQH